MTHDGECVDGWVLGREDGYEVVRPCACLRERRQDAILTNSGLSQADRIAAGEYLRLEHRAELDAALRRYLETDLGRADSRPFLVVSGEFGSGKTVALARAATYAVRKGLVQSLAYATEQVLRERASAVTDEAAQSWVVDLHGVELLVLDELGYAPMPDELPPPGRTHRVRPLTEHQAMVLDRLLMVRFNRMLPTLIGTNRPLSHPLGPLGWIGGAVASRAAAHARCVSCTGMDLRRGT